MRLFNGRNHRYPKVALAARLPSMGWHSFRHTVSAWGKEAEAGLKLEDVKTLLRHEDIATTSNVYGDLGMDVKRRIQRRLVAFGVRQRAGEGGGRGLSRRGSLSTYAGINPVILRDPYLTRVLFADVRQVQGINGSSGRTRTYNPPVNSRMLCH
jgi:hypothetical protein